MIYSAKMVSDQLDAALTSAILNSAVINGALVVLGNLAADTTYDANGLEYDLYEAAAPAAATDEVVLLDYAGISEGVINGNNYKMGKKLYDINVPANRPCRARRLFLHDKFWLSGDCFDTAPTVGKFATAAAGEFTHAASATAPQSGYYVKILAKEGLVAGMKDQGYRYLCEVMGL